ncbi:MAG: hypothetical protein H6738_00980 [Alphaproteobacteria bacterium]|nr:hypothetical protein [Alphaproteobacteria bacterium]MCB9695342.1 hypothetical protein [Alphaproteobacteria bacterium]
MEKVTVFLKTSLFTLPGADGHVPTGVMIIDATVVDRPSGALRVDTERMRDERGRVLSDKGVRLDLPWAKIDHLLLRDVSA